MGRQPCCEKVGLRRGPWTIEEDQKLINFILKNGIQCWRVVPKLAGNLSYPSCLIFEIFNWYHFWVLLYPWLLFNGVLCKFCWWRSPEMWKELQIEVDKLPEAWSQERSNNRSGGRSDHWTSFSSRQQVSCNAHDSLHSYSAVQESDMITGALFLLE